MVSRSKGIYRQGAVELGMVGQLECVVDGATTEHQLSASDLIGW